MAHERSRLDLNTLSRYGMRSMSSDNSTAPLAAYGEEAFRTDSGLAISGRSSNFIYRTASYGYGNREMVQRNEGV